MTFGLLMPERKNNEKEHRVRWNAMSSGPSSESLYFGTDKMQRRRWQLEGTSAWNTLISVSNPESGRWSLAPGIRHNYRIIFIDAAHAQQFRAMWSGWLAGQERRLITVLTDFMHCTAIHH